MNVKRLLAAMVLPLVFFALPALSQDKMVTGKVTDSKDGSDMPNATVRVKGSTNATQTDSKGNFRIKVPAAATTLAVSSIGYLTQEVTITGATVDVQLIQSSASLGEVVVIGYGTVRKKDLTGSVATITTKDFQQGSISTPEQLISGKVAGVSITSNGGSPGSGSVIRIRGGASLNASGDPLIVIDGVPVSGGVDASGNENKLAGTANGGASLLSLVNSDDIETFTVLKDAAATAIYGSRASNGVILITTKHGRSGKPVINFSTKLGVGNLPKEYPVLSAAQFRNYVNANGSAAFIAMLGNANTNWQKLIYQSAITTDNNLSFSGSLKNLPYRISGEYMDQGGILKTDDMKRYSVGLNLSPHLLKDHLKIDINLHGAITDSRFANSGAITGAITFDPTQPVYKDGSPFGGYNEWTQGNDSILNSLANRNPVAMLQQYFNKSHVERSFGNIQFDYALPYITGLHANLNLGYDVAKGTGSTYIPADAGQAWNNSVDSLRGSNNPYRQQYTNKVAEFYLSYNKDIKAIKSNINAVAGYGYYDNYTQNYNYASFSATNDTIPATQPQYPTTPTQYTLISYYARLIYTFDNKYILMGSIRTDGSSRFGPDYRWGKFPSAAFTWKASQEDFLRNVKALSVLNVRLSYGVTGNQNGIPLYGYIPTYFLSNPGSLYPFGDTYYNMYTPSAYVSNLKWEKTGTYDAGIDYGFLNNRITGSVDYYYKKTSDLLANVSIPSGSNYANKVTTNVGNMTDKGIDFSVNLIPITKQNLTWEVSFNASYNKFKITNLTLSPNPNFLGNLTGGIGGGTGNTVQVDAVGYAPNTFYLYQQIYNANGKPIEGLYVDQNRDGIINQSDLIKTESPYPSWTFGFSNNLNYKKWNFNFVIRANVGNYVYNNMASSLAVTRSMLNPILALENAPSSVLSSNFYNNQYISNYYLENASFLRMDNIGLGYNCGAISKLNKRSNLRISLNCQNVFVITKYSGMDPEIYGGIDNNFYPRPRTFTLGLNLSL